jgi:hypothetical protein
MMKKLVLAFLLIPVLAQAQATNSSRLVWEQPNATLAEAQAYTYRYYPDGNATGTSLTNVICAEQNTTITCASDFPAFTPGSHSLTITALNAAGESSQSAPFMFTFVVLPSTPINIRIG